MSSSVWSDVPRRIATIAIGVPIILVILSNQITANLFFLGVHLLCCLEWIRLQQSFSLQEFALFASLSVATAHLSQELIPLGLLLSVCMLFLYQFPSPSLHLLFGMIFLSIPMAAWYMVAFSFRHTVSLLLIVWNCDTGALVVGRLSRSLGLPSPQIPWLHQISPAKSLAGIVGGFLFGIVTTMNIPWLWRYFGNDSSNWEDHTALLGVVLSTSAILGDLVESAVKRTTGRKDSSKLLPGHGGILDRFDSSFLSVVVYYYWCLQKGN